MSDEVSDGWKLAIADELSRITGRGANKKQATIQAIIEAELTGTPIETIWGKNGLPHRNTYHRKDRFKKDGTPYGWKYDPTFASVLQNARQLTTDWRTAERLRKFEERAEKWDDQITDTVSGALSLANQLIEKAGKMVQYPLVTQVLEDGTKIVQPAKWTMDTAARYAKTAVDLANAANALLVIQEKALNPQQPPGVTIHNNITQQTAVQASAQAGQIPDLENADHDELDALIQNMLLLSQNDD